MLKVIFYIKSQKVDKDGLAPIFARISLRDKSITMATGKSISKERWLFTNNLRNVLKMDKEKVIKEALEVFQLNLEKKFYELSKIDADISVEFLRDEIKGKTKINEKPKSITILEVMGKHADFFKRKVETGERAPRLFSEIQPRKRLIGQLYEKAIQSGRY